MNPSDPSPPLSRDPDIARCPRCGRPFDCGARSTQAGGPPCWCVSMPALPAEALKRGLGCLCPECLAEALAEAQAARTDNPTARSS
ncbi:cysteine-rich CWC family protein [Paraburkholderia phosphatilytica]|uniref:cysteine-rich CWC family protein n=1 Tax=Paraburkholderia phosphatilytica TaxID=2282883 RepID=UPI000E4DA81B|nr:cysteine-rich CWC family protein [Paraburkholderia phosphatilytica]